MEEVKFNKLDKPQLLLDIKLNSEIVDIHNDFDCIKIEMEKKSLFLKLKKSDPEKNFTPQTKFNHGSIEFKEFEIKNLNTLLLQKLPATINNLSIGEIYYSDKEKNKKCFFVLDFVDSDEYEIITSEVIVKFW
jgi:hypothetical protein